MQQSGHSYIARIAYAGLTSTDTSTVLYVFAPVLLLPFNTPVYLRLSTLIFTLGYQQRPAAEGG